jgi:hypothetical protein
MTIRDEQLLEMLLFLERADDNNCNSLTHCEERIADIAVLCSIVLYSGNRRAEK